jgi:peptidoglycan hydrolase-like protein with peptidoglycan-binding domain
VVQQKQGRVKPTMQMKDAAVNNDMALEKEADDMGRKSINVYNNIMNADFLKDKVSSKSNTMQFVMKIDKKPYAAGTKWLDKPENSSGNNATTLHISDVLKDVLKDVTLEGKEEIAKIICNEWAKQNLNFKNVEDFKSELEILLNNWSSQCYLYKMNPDSSPLITNQGTNSQKTNSKIKLYSTREAGQIIDLWNVLGNVSKKHFPRDILMKGTAKEFTGHMGDRAAALQYFYQNNNSEKKYGMIMIEFTSKGSCKLIEHFRENNHDKGGDRKPGAGEIVTKKEKETFSVAVNHNFLESFKDDIESIQLVKMPPIWEASPQPGSSTEK